MMKHTVCFTICARNYLGFARTLHQSLIRHHPDVTFVLFLADEPDETLLSALDFTVIPARTLSLANFADMTLRYDVMELATAIKPACFQTLLNEEGVNRAIYLDPDILITAPLIEIDQTMNEGHELVLTPHIQSPYHDHHHPDDHQIMRAGAYNLGFAAMADSSDVRELLTWWQGKLLTGGHNDIENGQFVDQRYMDMAPSFVDKTQILSHRGYNAAYWNLHERPIKRRGDQWFAGKDPLAFFHFSGVVPGDRRVFSKHQNRFNVDTIGELAVILREYLSALSDNNQSTYSTIPYAYDFFSDDEPISPIMRKAYADYVSTPIDQSHTGGKLPLVMSPDWFCEHDQDLHLPALMAVAWKTRPDLQRAFPLDRGHLTEQVQKRKDAHKGFVRWFAEHGSDEFSIPNTLVETVTTKPSSDDQAPVTSIPAISTISRGAGKLLKAAPSLRPLYRHVPKGLRSIVKTALYRTYTNELSNSPEALGVSVASGTFDSARMPGIHLYGYLRSQSGIGQGARGLASVLKHMDLPLAITSFTNPNDRRETYPFVDIAPSGDGHRIALIDANAEQVLRLEELVDPDRLAGTYRIAYWVWELEEFPSQWLGALAYIDEIWVPSEFVASALRKVTDKLITVVPHLVQADMPSALGRQHFDLPEDRVVFLTSFDVNSFVRRKNPNAVISAFTAAFNEDSPGSPILAIKVHGSHGERQTRQVLESHIGNAANIRVIDQTLRRDEYLALQHLSDVFVSLHRAEGFGLNIAEAMAIGKPVIATDYSGNRDYLTDRNAIPIPFKMVDIPAGAYPHGDGLQWAEPDLDAAMAAMQRLAVDRRLRERLGKAAAKTIASTCDFEPIRDRIATRLKAIDPTLLE